MSRDRLADLLTETDALLPPPGGKEGLMLRVQARSIQRARTRAALAVIASFGIMVVALHWNRTGPATVREARPDDSANQVRQLRAQLAALDATAKMHQNTANELMEAEHRRDSLRHAEIQLLMAPDPLAYLDEARERAARIIVMDANRYAAGPDGNVRAEQAYRRAARLFPDTAAAHEASERLKATGA